MLKLKAGRRQVWQSFALDITDEISFEMNFSYQLCGVNGSGKSSFLQKILVPALQEQADCYIVYLQQQMHLQLFALKAHAAFKAPGTRINSSTDAAKYLLEDLEKAYAIQPRDIYLIADECPCLEALQQLKLPHCLILIDHHERVAAAQTIRFETLNSALSKVTPDV